MVPKIIRKPVRHLRLDMRSGELVVVAPEDMPTERIVDAMRKHARWIELRQEKISQYMREANALSNTVIVFGRQRKTPPDAHELRLELRKRAEKILRDLSRRTGLTYRDLVIRNMRTKWASYTPNRNVVLNLHAAVLPERHLRYLLLHELAHSVARKHNDVFWTILRNHFADEDVLKIEQDLGKYWFYVEMNEWWRRTLGL